MGSVYVYGIGVSLMKIGMFYLGFYKFSYGEDGYKGICFIFYSFIFLISMISLFYK